MHFSVKVFAVSSISLVLVSCAPKPDPVTVDVVYDKFGDAVVYGCRPSTIRPNPNYPERLPICDQEGLPGNAPNPNAIAASTLPQWIPIDDDSDGGGNQPHNPNTPNPNAIAN